MRIDTKVPFSSGPSFRSEPKPATGPTKIPARARVVGTLFASVAILILSMLAFGAFILLGKVLGAVAADWVNIRAYLLTGLIFFGFWTAVVMLLNSVLNSLGEALKNLIHGDD